jgi:predicted nucleic acid-binding protein
VLLPRIWQRRGSLAAYDVAYVALAEAIEAPLVTADGTLGRSHGHAARIEVFAA